MVQQKASLFSREAPSTRKRKSSKSAAPSNKKSNTTTSTDTKSKKERTPSKASLYPAGTQSFGIVTKVGPTFLFVTLPGDVVGYVNISNISDEFSVLLKQEKGAVPLTSFFSIGDVVYAVVTQPGNRPTLSLVPSTVNFNVSPDSLSPATILSVSIQSEEDHGFLCNTGIDLPGFLPFESLSTSQREALKLGSVAIAKSKTSSPRNVVLSLCDSSETEVLNVNVDVSKLIHDEEVKSAQMQEKNEERRRERVEQKKLKTTSNTDIITKTELVRSLVVKNVLDNGLVLSYNSCTVFLSKYHLSDQISFCDNILTFLKLVFSRVEGVKHASRDKQSSITVLSKECRKDSMFLVFLLITS
ncbi:hypothetical protein GEMRC1_011704 [Eukaryota sp. GEM-RC1]